MAQSDLGFVTLYGKGAAIFHNGKDVIRAENGILRVPPMLVNQALAMGFTRAQTGPETELLPEVGNGVGVSGVVEVPALPATSVTSGETVVDAIKEKARTLRLLPRDERAAIYEQEVRAVGGYSDDAVVEIVDERLRFDDLIADGKTEEEAAAIVWPSEPESARIPAEGGKVD